ncbi:uncharacterized protein LOC119162025 [Rhipicephalus microplus]|uniref:uncharacterized protein LOC119162025 n=1 Tax=Rhipicephalus microplus TaxID=6941 RepID=UPI0023769FAC
MKVALFTLSTIAAMAVATASSIETVQSQPPIPEAGSEITSATPDSGFVPGIEAESGSETTSTERPSGTDSGFDFVADIAKGFGLSQFNGFDTNPGGLAQGGALGLNHALGGGGLGGLGHGAGLENFYGSLLGSGNPAFAQAAPFLGLGGGGKGSRGYSSVKTYNYKFDSNDPSNGAKQA